MSLIFDDKDDKEVKVRNLSIEKNIFEYEGSFLQISNISYATIIKERFHPNNAALIAAVLGLIMLVLGSNLGVLGFILLLFGGSYIGWQWYQYNLLGQYLLLQMNSGLTLKFPCADNKFLKGVLNVIRDRINNNMPNIVTTIDFSNSTITNSTVCNDISK